MASAEFKAALRAASDIIADEADVAPSNRSFLLAGRRPAGTAVLLLHGFSASPYEVFDLAKSLHRNLGAAVFAPRLASIERHEFETSSRQDWRSRAERAFPIAKSLGRNLVVIGQSGGGVQATLLTAAHAADVKALVLAAPAFRLANPAAPLARLGFVRLLIREVNFNPPKYADVNAHWIMRYSTRAVAQLVAAGIEAQKAALGLRLPLALLQASDDTVVSTPFNQRLFARIPARDKRLLIYDSDEHNVLHRHNGKQRLIFDWIEGFLRETA